MVHAETQQWYVVYSKPHKEELAQFSLQRKGVEVFFPRLRLPYASRRKRIVPLFPNYIFARVQEPAEYAYVRWSPGVKCIVNFNGTPASVDERVVAFLRQQATSEGILTARSTLVTGQEVRLVQGPFAGLDGIIQNPPDARGRVKVLLELLGRPVRVEVSVQSVEQGWTIASGETERMRGL